MPFLDCDDCVDDGTTRQCLGCGFLPSSQHMPSLRAFDSSVCPGYLTQMPEVIEAARALSWSKRGGLAPVYGGGQLPPVAIDAVDILEGSVNATEAKGFRERRQEAQR